MSLSKVAIFSPTGLLAKVGFYGALVGRNEGPLKRSIYRDCHWLSGGLGLMVMR